jgi:hypothetical protein
MDFLKKNLVKYFICVFYKFILFSGFKLALTTVYGSAGSTRGQARRLRMCLSRVFLRPNGFLQRKHSKQPPVRRREASYGGRGFGGEETPVGRRRMLALVLLVVAERLSRVPTTFLQAWKAAQLVACTIFAVSCSLLLRLKLLTAVFAICAEPRAVLIIDGHYRIRHT